VKLPKKGEGEKENNKVEGVPTEASEAKTQLLFAQGTSSPRVHPTGLAMEPHSASVLKVIRLQVEICCGRDMESYSAVSLKNHRAVWVEICSGRAMELLPPVLKVIRPCRGSVVRERMGLFKGMLAATVDLC